MVSGQFRGQIEIMLRYSEITILVIKTAGWQHVIHITPFQGLVVDGYPVAPTLTDWVDE
mgnify:CR=1 FL=1